MKTNLGSIEKAVPAMENGMGDTCCRTNKEPPLFDV